MASPLTYPFDNGGRELVAYPQKRPLIVLTARPPQLETPFAVFNEGLLTPNDAFFVRYHLANIPFGDIDPDTWTVEVGQPWRNERAGLKDGDLAPGVEIRAIGEPAADPAAKRLKAERLYLGEREFILYPERD